MLTDIQPGDLGFFSTLAASGSLTAAAREMGISPPAVSKRLSQMEARLGVALVTRTTRRMSMTPEGDIYLEHARRILGEIDELKQLLGSAKVTPKGLLRVNATLGFGRCEVAPIISKFARKYPLVEVQLQLSVNPPLITDDVFDVCVRFGVHPTRASSPVASPLTGAFCARRPATSRGTDNPRRHSNWPPTIASAFGKETKPMASGDSAVAEANIVEPNRSKCAEISSPMTERLRSIGRSMAMAS